MKRRDLRWKKTGREAKVPRWWEPGEVDILSYFAIEMGQNGRERLRKGAGSRI